MQISRVLTCAAPEMAASKAWRLVMSLILAIADLRGSACWNRVEASKQKKGSPLVGHRSRGRGTATAVATEFNSDYGKV